MPNILPPWSDLAARKQAMPAPLTPDEQAFLDEILKGYSPQSAPPPTAQEGQGGQGAPIPQAPQPQQARAEAPGQNPMGSIAPPVDLPTRVEAPEEAFIPAQAQAASPAQEQPVQQMPPEETGYSTTVEPAVVSKPEIDVKQIVDNTQGDLPSTKSSAADEPVPSQDAQPVAPTWSKVPAQGGWIKGKAPKDVSSGQEDQDIFAEAQKTDVLNKKTGQKEPHYRIVTFKFDNDGNKLYLNTPPASNTNPPPKSIKGKNGKSVAIPHNPGAAPQQPAQGQTQDPQKSPTDPAAPSQGAPQQPAGTAPVTETPARKQPAPPNPLQNPNWDRNLYQKEQDQQQKRMDVIKKMKVPGVGALPPALNMMPQHGRIKPNVPKNSLADLGDVRRIGYSHGSEWEGDPLGEQAFYTNDSRLSDLYTIEDEKGDNVPITAPYAKVDPATGALTHLIYIGGDNDPLVNAGVGTDHAKLVELGGQPPVQNRAVVGLNGRPIANLGNTRMTTFQRVHNSPVVRNHLAPQGGGGINGRGFTGDNMFGGAITIFDKPEGAGAGMDSQPFIIDRGDGRGEQPVFIGMNSTDNYDIMTFDGIDNGQLVGQRRLDAKLAPQSIKDTRQAIANRRAYDNARANGGKASEFAGLEKALVPRQRRNEFDADGNDGDYIESFLKNVGGLNADGSAVPNGLFWHILKNNEEQFKSASDMSGAADSANSANTAMANTMNNIMYGAVKTGAKMLAVGKKIRGIGKITQQYVDRASKFATGTKQSVSMSSSDSEKRGGQIDFINPAEAKRELEMQATAQHHAEQNRFSMDEKQQAAVEWLLKVYGNPKLHAYMSNEGMFEDYGDADTNAQMHNVEYEPLRILEILPALNAINNAGDGRPLAQYYDYVIKPLLKSVYGFSNKFFSNADARRYAEAFQIDMPGGKMYTPEQEAAIKDVLDNGFVWHSYKAIPIETQGVQTHSTIEHDQTQTISQQDQQSSSSGGGSGARPKFEYRSSISGNWGDSDSMYNELAVHQDDNAAVHQGQLLAKVDGKIDRVVKTAQDIAQKLTPDMFENTYGKTLDKIMREAGQADPAKLKTMLPRLRATINNMTNNGTILDDLNNGLRDAIQNGVKSDDKMLEFINLYNTPGQFTSNFNRTYGGKLTQKSPSAKKLYESLKGLNDDAHDGANYDSTVWQTFGNTWARNAAREGYFGVDKGSPDVIEHALNMMQRRRAPGRWKAEAEGLKEKDYKRQK